MIGLVGLVIVFVAALILAIAFVPSGETLQDAEHDANNGRVLFVVLMVVCGIAAVMIA